MNQEKVVRTLIRLGTSIPSLEEAVQNSTERFEGLRIMNVSAAKYITFNPRGPYLLSVSGRQLTPKYNVLITCTSYSDEINRITVEQLEKETGIRLTTETPKSLREPLKLAVRGIDAVFLYFERRRLERN